MNRAFTLNHATIIKRLADEFVPFAGNTAELQTEYNVEGYDAGKWFTKMSAQTECRKQGDTTQGMYIAGADGVAYCWKNTPGISDTLRFFDKGLAEFKKRPPQKVEITPDDIAKPHAHLPKPTTAVIAVYSRVRPIPEGADSRNQNIGRDFLWIAQSEVQDLLAQPADAGTELTLPTTLLARLCRFALVDCIRGEPDYWEPGELATAHFTLKNLPAEEGLRRYSLQGDFAFHTTWLTRGIKGRLDGEFTLDLKTETLTKFRAYAKSEAWGKSEWASRGVPQKFFTLVFGFSETHDKLSREIPPSALSRHKDYAQPQFPKRLQKSDPPAVDSKDRP